MVIGPQASPFAQIVGLRLEYHISNSFYSDPELKRQVGYTKRGRPIGETCGQTQSLRPLLFIILNPVAALQENQLFFHQYYL